MEIMVKKYTARPIFRSHYNTATGRYYGTKQEYLSDLKAKGLEPATSSGEHQVPALKHKPTRWSHEMVEAIKAAKQPDGSVRLGDRFFDELSKKGVKARPCR